MAQLRPLLLNAFKAPDSMATAVAARWASHVHSARHEGVWTVGQERSYGRMLLVSMLVLFLEAVLVLVVSAVYGQTQESPNAGGNYALGLLALPFLAVAGAFVGGAVSLVLVLPTVWLSDVLGRRFGGREVWWWVPLVAAAVALAPVIVGAALAGAVASLAVIKSWLLATTMLTVPALLSRPRRRGLFVPVALWGTLVVVSAGTLGGIALYTGLLEEYHPPTITRATLFGTWSDGKGGTLAFTADGRVTASGVDNHVLDESFDNVVKECTGQGTWTFEAGKSSWNQETDVTIQGCGWAPWNVGGTEDRITLYQYIGDPDSWDLYELKKAPSGA